MRHVRRARGWAAGAALLALGGAGPLRRGAVVLSDGDRIEGGIDLPALRVFALGPGKWLRIPPEKVARIRTEVAQEKVAQAWVFVEEGSREKIRLPERYPIRKYESEITLRDGTAIRGRIVAASFYVVQGEEERRFILRSHQKGAKGQTLDDLVFVRDLDFGERPPRRPLAAVRGRVPPGASLRLVACDAPHGFAAKVREDGGYVAAGLPPGRYDAVLRVGDRILAGFPARDAPAIDAATRARVERAVEAAREFFDAKRIVRLWGRPEKVRAFVELRRTGPTTLEGKGGSMRVRRWEVWEIDPEADPVRITGRVFLFRELLGPAAGFPRVRYAFDPSLAGLEVESPETTFQPSLSPGGDHGR